MTSERRVGYRIATVCETCGWRLGEAAWVLSACGHLVAAAEQPALGRCACQPTDAPLPWPPEADDETLRQIARSSRYLAAEPPEQVVDPWFTVDPGSRT